jgi:hypothetical protein
MFTLTIFFIALKVYVEFVLIYRPHPVHCSSLITGEVSGGTGWRQNRICLPIPCNWGSLNFTSPLSLLPVLYERTVHGPRCTKLRNPCFALLVRKQGKKRLGTNRTIGLYHVLEGTCCHWWTLMCLSARKHVYKLASSFTSTSTGRQVIKRRKWISVSRNQLPIGSKLTEV